MGIFMAPHRTFSPVFGRPYITHTITTPPYRKVESQHKIMFWSGKHAPVNKFLPVGSGRPEKGWEHPFVSPDRRSGSSSRLAEGTPRGSSPAGSCWCGRPWGRPCSRSVCPCICRTATSCRSCSSWRCRTSPGSSSIGLGRFSLWKRNHIIWSHMHNHFVCNVHGVCVLIFYG